MNRRSYRSVECYACGQPDPVLLRHLLTWSRTTRRIPGTTWVTLTIRAAWDKPEKREHYRGIVQTYRAGPLLLSVMPDRPPVESGPDGCAEPPPGQNERPS